jgi:excisionase family DNA binding protein
MASRPQVAELLAVPPGTLAQWAHRGVGPPYVRIGRHTRYRWEDVEAWLAQQKHGGEAA